MKQTHYKPIYLFVSIVLIHFLESAHATTDKLSTIPNDITGHIAGFLDGKSITQYVQVNKGCFQGVNLNKGKHAAIKDRKDKAKFSCSSDFTAANLNTIYTTFYEIRLNSESELLELLASVNLSKLPYQLALRFKFPVAKMKESTWATLSMTLEQSELKGLDLSLARVGDKGAEYLGRALPKSKLQVLTLDNNEITPVGAQSLAAGIAQSTTLRELDLSDNRLEDLGVQALTSALPQSQLSILHLGNNKIGSSGGTELAKVLPKTKITLLDLMDNRLNNEGALSIIHELNHCPHLRSLNLSNNKINEDGILEIAQFLQTDKTNSTLNQIKLGFNGTNELIKKTLNQIRNLKPKLIISY